MRLAILARAMVFALVITGVSAFGSEFRAGAGKSEIKVTPEMLPIEGYAAVHDQASVRVLLMDDGKSRFALFVVETPSISDSLISGVKAILTKVAGVQAENAIVLATHSTSAPHIAFGAERGGNARPGGGAPGGAPQGGANAAPGGGPGGGPGGMFSGPQAALYGKAYGVAVEAAVQQAVSSLQPAKLGYGVGATDINVNRDMPTPKGWAEGSYSAGFSDRTLPVVRIDKVDGKPIALLINPAVRSVVLDGVKDKDGAKSLSGDLAGATSRYIEKWYGGDTVVLFLMGAGVDQAPVLVGAQKLLNPDGSVTASDMHEAAFSLLDMLGARLGSDAIQTAQDIKPSAQPTVDVVRRTLKVPSQTRSLPGGNASNSAPALSYTYTTGPDVDFPVVVMRIGDIAIAGMWPELSSSIGAQIKTQSPFPKTIVVTMADGGSKYIVDEESFAHFTAEARGSQYARGAAEQAGAGIDDLLKEIKQSSAGK